MKINLPAAFKSVPRTLLLPLKDTGFFERFTGLQVNEQCGLDAILPAPSSDEALAMFAINMAHFWSEYLGSPSRTSLTERWLPGDILFSAEWSCEGWLLEVGYYRHHPAVDDSAIGVRIKRARPRSMLKLVHSNTPQPVS